MKKEERFWFGFLDAGEKSSPVLRDNTLETHDPETVYLFNLQRKAIIEYKRSIVESRLRALDDDEVATDLKAAYLVASKDFSPREKPALPTEPVVKPVAVAAPPVDNEASGLEDLAARISDEVEDGWEAGAP